MQANFVERQSVEARGGDWLLFDLVRTSLRPSKKTKSSQNLPEGERCNLALAAVIQPSSFLIRCLRTIRVQSESEQLQHRIQPLQPLVQIAGQSIIIYSESCFHLESSTLGNETLPAKYVEISVLTGPYSVNTPISQEIIVISEDRASTVFHEWEDRIRSKSDWRTPLALVATLAPVLAATTFNDHPWIKGGTIKGFFLAWLVLCFVWLAREILRAFRSPTASVGEFIAELKKGTIKRELGIPPNQES